MGVKRAYPFLKKQGYAAGRVCPRDVPGTKHVDFIALYFGYIATRLKTLLYRQYRDDFWRAQTAGEVVPPPSVLSNANCQQLAQEINAKLEADFDREDCLLHFDGASTLEKQAEHENRAARYDQDTDDANSFMDKILTRDTNILGRNPGVVTSSDRTKLVRWIKAATEHWRAVLGVPQSARTGLANALAQLGWRIHLCPGESDTCIAQAQSPLPGEQMIVVSTDSDYLFRSRDDVSLVLLRQNTQKRREFTRYDAHAVRTATGLSPAAWRILAITSGNDYAANKKHFGLARNLRLIRTICNEGYTLELDILTQYCQRTNMSVHHFGHAVTVFIYNGQTLLPPEVATTDLDDYLLASIFAVGFNLQEYAFMDSKVDADYHSL